ncbi:MAG: alpha/beta fold hydrolase [Methyloligellaceae bacterium]
MAIRRIPTDIGSLHADINGSGPAIIFWPSLMMDHTLWAPQVNHFSDRYTTIAIDPHGHGQSDPLDREFTLEECAESFIAILDDLGLEKAHIVGNSWGAMIGAIFAARHPDRIGCAILANGTASAASEEYRREVSKFCKDVLIPEKRAKFKDRRAENFLGKTTFSERPDLVKRVVESSESVEPQSASYAVSSVAVNRRDQHDLLNKICTPCLIIAGSEDRSFPVPELREMADAIPDAELVILEKVGHLAALEAPEQFNRLLEDFLNRDHR